MVAEALNSRPSPLPLPPALQAADFALADMADDLCEAAFAGATPSGPRKHYRARHYDFKIGGFISEDPAGFVDGPNF